MKKVVFFSMIIFLLFGSCNRKKKLLLEGAWQMVQFSWISGDTTRNYLIPVNGPGSQIKMWTGNHFAFLGTNLTDTAVLPEYGGGTYTLKGNRYEESIEYHNDKSLINTKFKALLEFRNDTLYQTNYILQNWKLPRYYGIEKYIRCITSND